MLREQVRQVDRTAIEQYGLPGLVLMENAGRGAAATIVRYHRSRENQVADQGGVQYQELGTV